MHVAIVGADRAHLAGTDIADADAFNENPAVGAEVSREALEDVHRVKLRLIREPDGAAGAERQPGVVDLLDGQTSCPADGQLRPDAVRSLVGHGEGVRIPALEGHCAVLEEPEQPGLALPVGFDIGIDHLLGVLPPQGGQNRALEEAELGCGVSGGPGPHRSGLQDRDRPAGPRQ